ncbi:MAG: hypothetical protein AAF484_09190 [Pseudomonadota bacterium]
MPPNDKAQARNTPLALIEPPQAEDGLERIVPAGRQARTLAARFAGKGVPYRKHNAMTGCAARDRHISIRRRR